MNLYVDDVDISPRRIYERENYYDILSDKDFFTRFRLQKPTVLNLLEILEPELEYPTNKNNSISPINQILITLRTYATGGHLLSIGDFVKADKSTICRTVHKVSRKIAALAPQYIYMPRNLNEIRKAQNTFFDIERFPKVIGVIDGTHIKILSPGGDNAETFRNRKGFFSINVQAIGSADYMFEDIVARWPGSAHDVTIFNNSRIKHRFEIGEFGDSIILGDSAYMNKKYLLTPILNTITRGQQLYNHSHIRTRVKIENLFGIWKRRFPILAYGCRMKLDNILPIIISTAVLHNIARLNGEPEPPLEQEIMQHELQQAIVAGEIPNPRQNLDGVNFRNFYVDNYFNNL